MVLVIAVTTVRVAIMTLALFFALTAALWQSLTLTLWFVVVAVLPWLPWKRSPAWRRVALVVLGAFLVYTAVFGVMYWKVPRNELHARMEYLHNTSYRNPARLTTYDRITIYCGNIAMGIAGSIPFPEVAWETLRMAYPGPREHIIRSDFAMKSERVRNALREFVKRLPAKGAGKVSMPRKRIAWVSWDYTTWGYTEARVALAVNCPFVLDADALWTGDSWRIECRGTCDVEYGRFEEMTTVFRHPLDRSGKYPFEVSETMFWALEELGWLHRFLATYVWTVDCDDKRLR